MKLVPHAVLCFSDLSSGGTPPRHRLPVLVAHPRASHGHAAVSVRVAQKASNSCRRGTSQTLLLFVLLYSKTVHTQQCAPEHGSRLVPSTGPRIVISCGSLIPWTSYGRAGRGRERPGPRFPTLPCVPRRLTLCARGAAACHQARARASPRLASSGGRARRAVDDGALGACRRREHGCD